MRRLIEKLYFWRTTTATVAVLFVLALAAAVGLSAAWAQQYDGRIAPLVRVGGTDLSGLAREEAVEKVRSATEDLLERGIEVDLDGRRATIPLITLRSGDTTEDVSFGVDAAVEEALGAGRSGNPALDVALLLRARFLGSSRDVKIPVSIARANVEGSVRAAFPALETPVTETAFAFTKTREGWAADVTEGRMGRAFAFDAFVPRLEAALSQLRDEPVRLGMENVRPEVERDAALVLVGTAVKALEAAPYLFSERPDGGGRGWDLSAQALSSMLVPRSVDGQVALDVEAEAFDAFLGAVRRELEVEAKDARFTILDGKVAEFATSEAGLALDPDETRRRFLAALGVEEANVHVALVTTQPAVSTDQVNDLGIVEELGVGTSSFKGSPKNRIRNIRNGVKLLDGILIAPEQEFSLIAALAPFTEQNGYLPELVIKGDKIEPELGGGLCQIGTTTFRAIMNSGFPVTERRNHSLVVSYYNDPGNGNPGTDATIYEPAPDLKFVNDTGHYVLLQTRMDEAKQSLSFHFWGTSDGRAGSYTPPQVLKWIPFGEDKRIETSDLPSGEEKCQSPHVGADTTFTYTIRRPDGAVEETVFDSHYRPLPRICLVGTGETAVEPSDGPIDAGGAVSAPVPAAP